MIDIYPYNKKILRRHTALKEAALDKLLSDHFGIKAATMSSARAGIYQIIKYFGLFRTDHILIPDFLCRSALYILNLQGFAVQEANARTKAVFVLHQWGYPQRMDIIMAQAKKRGWLVIEDCAHTFGSAYRGELVGTFGDAAVVSLPKFFPTYVGGAVLSRRDDIISHLNDVRLKPKSLGHRLFDQLSLRAARQNYLLRQPPFLLNAVYIKSIHFPRVAPAALRRFPETLADLKSAVARRQYLFKTLKKQAGKQYHPDELDEECDIVPLCVPIFFSESKLESARAMLKAKNIVADILHFDVNRNILDPHYKKCLAFPCHQYVTDDELSAMCDVIGRV